MRLVVDAVEVSTALELAGYDATDTLVYRYSDGSAHRFESLTPRDVLASGLPQLFVELHEYDIGADSFTPIRERTSPDLDQPGRILFLRAHSPAVVMVFAGAGQGGGDGGTTDTTPPVITAPDLVVQAVSASGAQVSYVVTATDAVDGQVDVTCAPASGSVFALGSTTVECSATDLAGNTATTTFTVSVIDTTAPTIVAPADVLIEADGLRTFADIGTATATDALPATVTDDQPQDGFPIGDTTVIWTATDSSGNAASATQLVSVVDTTPPAITAPVDVTLEAEGLRTSADIGTATATEALPVEVVDDRPQAGFPLGDTTVTWTATDSSGNATSATQLVTVVDTTAPAITAPPNITTDADTAGGIHLVLTPPAVSDLVDPAPALSTDAPVFFSLGATAVTWTATDFVGNSSAVVQTVTVTDSFPRRGGEERGAARFIVEFQVVDVVDPAPTVSATVNGVPVTDGTLLLLQIVSPRGGDDDSEESDDDLESDDRGNDERRPRSAIRRARLRWLLSRD